MNTPQERLDHLRKQIEAECISYGEIAELQELAEHIPEDDMLLREWAGIPEADPDNDEFECEVCHGVFDIEDSIKRGYIYVCPECNAQDELDRTH